MIWGDFLEKQQQNLYYGRLLLNFTAVWGILAIERSQTICQI